MSQRYTVSIEEDGYDSEGEKVTHFEISGTMTGKERDNLFEFLSRKTDTLTIKRFKVE